MSLNPLRPRHYSTVLCAPAGADLRSIGWTRVESFRQNVESARVLRGSVAALVHSYTKLPGVSVDSIRNKSLGIVLKQQMDPEQGRYTVTTRHKPYVLIEDTPGTIDLCRGWDLFVFGVREMVLESRTWPWIPRSQRGRTPETRTTVQVRDYASNDPHGSGRHGPICGRDSQ